MSRHYKYPENKADQHPSPWRATVANRRSGEPINTDSPAVQVPLTLLDGLDLCCAVVDAAGGIILVNQKWEYSFGSIPDVGITEPIWELLSHGEGPIPSAVQDVLRKLEPGQTVRLGDSRPKEDGDSERNIAWLCSRTTTSPTDDYFFLVVGRDLTAETRLRESAQATQRALAANQLELQRKTTALKEVIATIEVEKQAVADLYEHNISRVVQPLLQQLKERCGESEQHSLAVLESCLRSVLSPSAVTLERICPSLTVREIQICNMIRQGFSTKQIATVLVLSAQTIQTHRKNIRRKLGILSKRTSLEKSLQRLERDAADNAGRK